jgi:GTP cyclohydrolase III
MPNEYKEFEEIDKEYYEKMKLNIKTNNFLQYIGEDDYMKLHY